MIGGSKIYHNEGRTLSLLWQEEDSKSTTKERGLEGHIVGGSKIYHGRKKKIYHGRKKDMKLATTGE